jgi:hypothetical protein
MISETGVRLLRVVVASPSDVQPERNAVAQVVEALNRDIAHDRMLRIELSRWETDSHPGFHPEGPQGLIDNALQIQDCDLLVGIFWRRFGTPTKDSSSGTEHEFRLAYDAWKENQKPQIMMYFKQRSYTPQSKEETDQWGLVLNFKSHFPKEGLWWPYRSTLNFRDIFREHLTLFIRTVAPLPDLVEPSRASPTAPPYKDREANSGEKNGPDDKGVIPGKTQGGSDSTAFRSESPSRSVEERASVGDPVSLPNVFSSEDLKKTMSNPKYTDDFVRLETSPDTNSVINPETVFIVVGTSVPAELLDRPVAEFLRDQIDRRGRGLQFHRAIVVTDTAWYAKPETFSKNPTIAVGGPPANELSSHLNDQAEQPRSAVEFADKRVVPGPETISGAFTPNREVPQIALWGRTAGATKKAIERYALSEEGLLGFRLDEFLQIAWK